MIRQGYTSCGSPTGRDQVGENYRQTLSGAIKIWAGHARVFDRIFMR